MKRIICLLTILLLASCAKTSDKTLIVGSWKCKDISPSGEVSSDRVTFYANDSMTGEVYANGKIAHQLSAKYSIDEKTRTLTTFPTDKMTFKFKILLLTAEELELQKEGKKTVDHYIRY